MTAVALRRGEFVKRDGISHWIYAHCDRADTGWWCDTHQMQFPNRDALVEHCRTDGDHYVARWCSAHGYEAPPPKSSKGDLPA